MEASVKTLQERKLSKFPGAVPFILSICCIERYAANSIVGKFCFVPIKLNATNENKIKILTSDFGLVFE